MFLAVRAVGVAVLGLMAAGRDMPLVTALRSWDANWLLNIAHYGYDDVPAVLVDAFGRHTAERRTRLPAIPRRSPPLGC